MLQAIKRLTLRPDASHATRSLLDCIGEYQTFIRTQLDEVRNQLRQLCGEAS
jgi:hypothetical protein